MAKALFMIGRAILGGFFLYNGINHFKSHEMLTGYAQSKGFPMPGKAITISGMTLLLGGASLITGIKPKFGAMALTGFLAAVSPTIHDFWKAEDPQQRMNDMSNFGKNMALLGSALMLMGMDESRQASGVRGRRWTKSRLHLSAETAPEEFAA
jgi:putative oxidoreductase